MNASTAVIAAKTRKGRRTRQEILDLAVDLASHEGLEGLTIGQLAQQTGMSKSGLFAHFGSKADLQLAVVDHARDIFVRKIVDPARAEAKGVARLRALVLNWLDYLEQSLFSGGCFFAAASAEFDGRPGAVRDRLVALLREWLNAIEFSAQKAREMGELSAETDPRQIAFEVHALVMEANWAHQLLDDKDALRRARVGIENRLRAASAKGAPPSRENAE